MRLALIALLLLGISGLASSESNKDSHRAHTANHQQTGDASETVVVVNEDAAGQKSANDDANKKAESDEQIANYTHQLAVYTLSLAVLTGVLAFLGIIQLRYLIRSDRTASKSANASERAIVAANRAWIKVDFEPGPITYDPRGARIDIKILLTNVGHSPATNVELRFIVLEHLVQSEEELERNNDAVKKLVETGREKFFTPDYGDTIFPGDTPTLLPREPCYYDLNMALSGLFMTPEIVCVVNYQIGFDDINHITCSVVDVMRHTAERSLKPGMPDGVMAFDIRHGDLAAEEVAVRRSIWRASFAD